MTVVLEACLDPDGGGILLRSRSGQIDRVYLRENGIVARRHPQGSVLPLRDCERLLVLPDVRWDAVARRCVVNVLGVFSHAQSVLSETRRIREGGREVAEALVSDSRLIAHLDEHQLINLAVLTVPGGWGGCVFDEQGTGKTVTIISVFDLLVERGEADVLLVVCPKTMAAEWAKEFVNFTGDLYRVAVAADGPLARRAQIFDADPDVIVMNYETAAALRDSLRLLARRSRLVLAVDESFFVKNPAASRTAALTELRQWCTRAFALCGTPAPNAPADVVAQFDLVDFGYTFEHTTVTNDRETDLEPVRQAMESRGLYTRNLKDEVLPDLPRRTFDDVIVPMTGAQKDAYEATRDGLVADLRSIDDATFERSRSSFFARRARLLRICSDPASVLQGFSDVPAKDGALDCILEELISRRGEKVVLWSFYRASLDRLAKRYARFGMVRVDGSVTQTSERRSAVQAFQSDDTTMLFLANPAAAGAGLTLHRARTMVYESMSNQAAHYLQSLDRVHRRGQTREVRYLTLLTEGTLEESEYARLHLKSASQADLLGDAVSQRVTREVMLHDLLGEHQS